MITIKVKTLNIHTFVTGSKYLLTHQTHPLESFYAKHIGRSRIDGFAMFQFLPTDAKYPISQYSINGDSITDVDIVGKLEDQLSFFEESAYQKNSSVLLEYCMDHYKINKSDLGDDERFKPMMREIILSGLLPK